MPLGEQTVLQTCKTHLRCWMESTRTTRTPSLSLYSHLQCLGTWVVGTQYPQSLGKPEWEKDECVTSTKSHHTPALHVRGAP